MSNPIYVITTMYVPDEKLKENGFNWDTDIRERVVGFFHLFENAENAVIKNWGDIYENGYYNIVVIEKAEEGLYNSYEESHWYKYNKEYEKYVKIDKPNCFKNTVGFGIG